MQRASFVFVVLACVVVVGAGCPAGGADGNAKGKGEAAEGSEGEGEAVVYEDIDTAFVVVDDRPATVVVPSAYDGTVPLPFVLLLHGYGISGDQMDRFTGFAALAEQNDLLYAAPDGTLDQSGEHFWNASPACCDFGGAAVDDSAYLRSIIDAARARANIDPARIFVVGHSNGGFMAHRLACDHADVISAVVSMAGAIDALGCAPSEPVAVLQVHGTADTTIVYGGGTVAVGLAAYPGAADTAGQWAFLDGCDGAAVDDPTALDFDSRLAGAETRVSRFENCDVGGAAELWTVEGAGHIINGSAAFVPALLGFLEDHHR